jgi:hypothetical protein
MRHKTALLTIAVIILAITAQGTMAGGKIKPQTTVNPVRTGQVYVPSLRLFRTPIAGRVPSLTVHKAAVFPFADYTHQQSFIRPLEWGANRIIVESLTDRFLSQGIAVALQEDVEGLLVANGIIRPPSSHDMGVTSPMERFQQRAMIANTPEFELSSSLHDDVMRDEIMAVVRAGDDLQPDGGAMSTPGEPFIQGITSGLPREKIAEFGRLLDVDLIIRGRILEYGMNVARSNTAVVQLRVYAQEARTGEVFWSNRAEVEVRDTAVLRWSPADLKALFDSATQEVVQTLMADFFGER